MKKLKVLMVSGFLLGLLVSYADAMRCGNNLVTVGDSKAKVLLVCGEPMISEVIATEKTDDRKELVEAWTYHRGPGSFLQILTFRGGKLILIETGDRT